MNIMLTSFGLRSQVARRLSSVISGRVARPKVTLYVATSEDGFIADRNGGVDWLPAPELNAKDEVGYNAFYGSMDALIMGSRTYEQVLTFGEWPYKEKKTYVATSRLLPGLSNVEFVSNNLDATIEKIGRTGIKNLWLVGGRKLIDSFYDKELIDEYIITKIPKILEDGIMLPKPILDGKGLSKQRTIEFKGGIQQDHYISVRDDSIKKLQNDLTPRATNTNDMGYNFYSHIHRYMRFKLSDFGIFVAKIDFRDNGQSKIVFEEFNKILMLLQGHGKHEDEVYHKMLQQRGSMAQAESEKEHNQQEKKLNEMQQIVEDVMSSNNKEVQNRLGYEFYLKYTAFVADYLKHLIREETVLMSEFRKLYSEDEIREVTFTTYRKMSVDDMNGMLEVLFPYINAVEREVFLSDIKEGTPEKLEEVWRFIAPKLEFGERKRLSEKLQIKEKIEAQVDLGSTHPTKFLYELYQKNKMELAVATAVTTAAIGLSIVFNQ